MDHRSPKTWLRSIAVAVAVTVYPSISVAQSIIAYRDGDGQWQWMEAAATQAFARKAAAPDETIGGTFTVTYEDLSAATGVGFDDPVSGAARRETLRAVLLYLTSVLDVPGTADILVRASQTDGRGPLAAAGPYLLPITGFQGGLVFEHLTTGVDPLPNELDGVVTVDFGFRWNTETSGPSPVEYDLYTVLLHEVTHALGFLSVVGPDGASALGNAGDLGLLSLFDAFLIRGSTEQPLFLDGGENNATAEDVTSGDVLFAGSRSDAAFGSFPPVFAPDPFLEGSSIGHWSFLTGDDAVMLPAVDRGERRREYKAWELQTLGDLGYDVVTCGDGFVAGAEQCDDGNANDLDGCSASCEVEDVIPTDAGVPDPPDASIPDASIPGASIPGASIPDASIPDASIPDAGEPDAMPDAGAGEDTPSSSADPPGNPSPTAAPDTFRSDDELPTAASSQSPAGCTVGGTGTDTMWPILLALLLTARRRFVS
jgi:cysteine-rich repeat protein